MPQSVKRIYVMALCAIAVIPMASCGYHFQDAHNPLLDLGIHRIYVPNFRNKTYRPGIEHYFTTAMVREIGHSKSFELVNSEGAADAVLQGEVTQAEDSITGKSAIIVGARTQYIANDFTASVLCQVVLRDRHGRQIFVQSVSGNKEHPGIAGKGDAGSTGPLINDSEERLAIQFIANQMMASVYQHMVDTF